MLQLAKFVLNTFSLLYEICFTFRMIKTAIFKNFVRVNGVENFFYTNLFVK